MGSFSPMTAKHSQRLGNGREQERAGGEGGEQLDRMNLAGVYKVEEALFQKWPREMCWKFRNEVCGQPNRGHS